MTEQPIPDEQSMPDVPPAVDPMEYMRLEMVADGIISPTGRQVRRDPPLQGIPGSPGAKLERYLEGRNFEYCPTFADPKAAEWTEQQSNGGPNGGANKGTCRGCTKEDVYLRIEPFGQTSQCKECWERICYGDE